MSKLVKTELEAVKLSLLMWRWLNENPLKRKESFPQFFYLRFDDMHYNCACCDFYNYENKGNKVCRKCALKHCIEFNSDYSVWYNANGDIEISKQASANIVSKLEKRLHELEYKNIISLIVSKLKSIL